MLTSFCHARYSNSFAGTKETALYDIDIANWTYVRQAPPNDGILNTLGQVTLTLTSHDAGGLTERDFKLARRIDE